MNSSRAGARRPAAMPLSMQGDGPCSGCFGECYPGSHVFTHVLAFYFSIRLFVTKCTCDSEEMSSSSIGGHTGVTEIAYLTLLHPRPTGKYHSATLKTPVALQPSPSSYHAPFSCYDSPCWPYSCPSTPSHAHYRHRHHRCFLLRDLLGLRLCHDPAVHCVHPPNHARLVHREHRREEVLELATERRKKGRAGLRRACCPQTRAFAGSCLSLATSVRL